MMDWTAKRQGLKGRGWSLIRTAVAGCAALTMGCGAQPTFAGHRWAEQKDDSKPYAIEQLGPDHFRFEVRGQDEWKNDQAHDRNRAELKSDVTQAFGQDVWFSYQMKVQAGPPSTARFCILGQFHHTNDPWDVGGSPPFAINLFPNTNTLRFIKRYTADRKTTATTDTVMYETAPIRRDQWMHIVGHVVFGWHGDGTVELWLDGRKIVDLPHTSIGYNDLVGPYWKFGIYRGGSPENLVVEYANMEIGPASLLGRVGHPLPID